ncbi:MAG: hypothetical protein AB1772_05085 [Candidatus Zixiibacteriota bacterium]
MMRKSLVVMLAMAVVAIVAYTLQAQEGEKWLDPANCYYCQPLTQTEGLMENLGWENYNIKNGSISVTTYKPEWKEKWKAASAEMQKRWMAMPTEAEHPKCGMCKAWSEVPMDRVSWENVEFTGGELGITTSTDTAVVAQLHSITDKTRQAMEDWMKAEAEAKAAAKQ